MALRLGFLPLELLSVASISRPAIAVRPRTISTSNLPRVAQPSLWHSIVPRFLRRKPTEAQDPERTTGGSGKEWNAATPFILLGVLVGSQAIHLINLKKDMVQFSRKTDAKLALLREVIKRVQAGENVDVEKILGTGDPTSEREWEEVMQEIENDDHLWRESKWAKRKAKARAAREERVEEAASKDDPSAVKTEAVTLQPSTRSRFY